MSLAPESQELLAETRITRSVYVEGIEEKVIEEVLVDKVNFCIRLLVAGIFFHSLVFYYTG